jgi:hypothetical protein
MTRVVQSLVVTADARVRLQTRPCEICGAKSDKEQVLGLLRVFPVSTIPPALYTNLHLHNVFPRLRNEAILGSFETQCFFGNAEALVRELISVFFKWRNSLVVRNLCSARHELGFISIWICILPKICSTA